MEWTGVNELRESFLSFFESKNHLRHPSASLVPQEDDSLLLINSGMAPLKNYFLGLETPPNKRMTTCQKCIRTPDIEEVGKTDRHGTYFEMLGNFSFGDYFKEDATKWALEFFVDVLKIPEELIWVSIYEEDDEAYEIWTKNRGISPDKVVRLGKEDNFWEIGSGPCGPCSEIYIDRGEEYACDAPECGIGKCECDRYMEIWNLVFTQYNSDGNGNYTPLEHPNIDTGMGLERIACVLQNVSTIFEVDTIQNIMNVIGEMAGLKYGDDAETDISLRVVTDHIRSTVFMVGDGILPSNEGRGYVLRRLLRRAARHGRLIGIEGTFLYKVADSVIEENKNIYPELLENADYIKKIILAEEERFAKTIEQGMDVLVSIMDKIETKSIKDPVISGEDAFRLYDTYGFPIDLTREIAADKGVLVDEDGFLQHMKIQRDMARQAHASQEGVGWEADILQNLDVKDEFVGYETLTADAKITALVRDGELVDSLLEGQDGVIILSKTPFYAEGGGQVGDTGTISYDDHIFRVENCQVSPTGHYLHIGKVEKGSIKNNTEIVAQVDENRRDRIMRNHTATHLMHAALREVLGDHVHQAGSYVDDHLTRFDFTHFNAVTPEELQKVEDIVNKNIMRSYSVTAQTMPIDKAKEKGAMALFGDKYSDEVRVCSIGDASIELCGGTHVSNSAQIGIFKIISESSVAAGVRRIEATTGYGVLDLLNKQNAAIENLAEILKVNSPVEVPIRAATMVEQISQLEKEVTALESEIASSKTKGMDDALEQVGPVKFGAIAVTGSSMASLQEQADRLKDKHSDIVGVFVALGDESATALVFAGKDAVKAGVHSGKLIGKLTAIAGGKGGGRPDNAKGGMPDITKVDEALSAAKALVKEQVEG